MSKKDNFSQAMYEMFGLGKAPEEPDDAEELDDLKQLENLKAPAEDFFADEPAAEPVITDEPVMDAPVAEPDAETATLTAEAESAPAEADFFGGFKPNSPVQRTNCTYFAEGTSMEGTLRSDSDIEIVGDFTGEIASDGKVTIHSNTKSSIAAAELVLVDCTLTGDSLVAGDVSINERSSIMGNIRAANLICSGVIKGNLTIQNNITLTENAQIIGDIKTGTLSMARGAKVSGKIDMGG